MSETPCEWLDGLLNGDYDFTVYSRKNARAELAQLRASDIRTMEHCDVCGSLLALDADALEDVEPFCPYCEYQEAIIMISEREKTIESLRANLQAAQERGAQLEAVITLNDYVLPPFDLVDDATVQLALECVAKDQNIAQLRADADELQRIRELIDPLNGQSVYDAVDALLHDESSTEIYKAEIAEQAQQLAEARDTMIAIMPHLPISGDNYNTLHPARRAVDAWLAANPAPQESQTPNGEGRP